MAENTVPTHTGETDTFKLAMKLTKEDGTESFVELSVVYPKNNGIAALEALHRARDYAPSLGVTLAEKGDESILREFGGPLDEDEQDENEQNEEPRP